MTGTWHAREIEKQLSRKMNDLKDETESETLAKGVLRISVQDKEMYLPNHDDRKVCLAGDD